MFVTAENMCANDFNMATKKEFVVNAIGGRLD